MPMMTLKRIINFMTAERFRPFRINLASGKHYGIRPPEMIAPVARLSAYRCR
jgi:hypothetical protein